MLGLISDANTQATGFLQNHPRQPALTHALDPNLFTPALCDTLAHCQAQKLLLQGYDAIWGLFWIRCFYSASDGNNYQQVGQGINSSALSKWLRATADYPGLAPDATTGDKLRAECPIVSAESQGETSQLIQGMRFLLEELRPGFDPDDYDSALAHLQARPNVSKGQIAAARLYPEAFKAVIRALQTGEGVGWLTRFADHPLRREILQWGVYCNGNHHDLAFCIPTSSNQVLKQGNKDLNVSPFEGRLIVPLAQMLKAGIDPCFAFSIGAQSLPPLTLHSPLIARFRRNTTFSPFIQTHTNLQIQAAALWTATPGSPNQNFLLGDQDPVVELQKEIPGFGHLSKLALDRIDRSQPLPLTFAGQCLVNIGAAPELTVNNSDPWVQSLNEPLTHFVFSDQSQLILSDSRVDPNDWSCSPGAALNWLDHRPILHCNTNYGRRLAASVDADLSYPLRVVIRFLPRAMRQAMIDENAWATDKISWAPLYPDDPNFKVSITDAGLVGGRLTVGNEAPISVWFPSSKPHFWLKHGFHTPTQVDEATSFPTLNELRQRNLHVYIPPGTHQIRWGGQTWMECEGPGHWEELLSDLDGEWQERESDNLEIVQPNGQTTRIATVMDRPQGSAAQVAAFAEAGFDEFLMTEFTLEELAQQLDCLIIDGAPWPARWSWSGQGLASQVNHIYRRCILTPNDALRIPPVAANPAAIRRLSPILEGLQTISQGNRPDQAWLALSTFRLRPASPTYGFHGLLVGGPVQWCLQDPRQTQIRSEFAYEGNTVFRRPGEAASLPWQAWVQPQHLVQQAARQVDLNLEPGDHQLIRGYFLAALGWSESLIGGLNDDHLAYVFKRLSQAFAGNPDRGLCFETAVLCRLFARMEAHAEVIAADAPIQLLAQPRVQELLKNLCWSIGRDPVARDVFGSDLLTVEWALAWFHEPIPHL